MGPIKTMSTGSAAGKAPVQAQHETIPVQGWVRTTLLDFPGKVASTLFLPGCNFRCPYCHNKDLVSPVAAPGTARIPSGEVLAYLARYARMLEGVCITGGEPLLQTRLPALCRSIKDLGLQVKLDTNGSMPGGLKPLLEEGLVDFVAMDIKGPPKKLQSITRSTMRQEDLVSATEKSVESVREAGIPLELRTTVVPDLLEPHDFHSIGEWMRGCPQYVLQQFRPGSTLDPLFQDLAPYPPETLQRLCRSLSEAGYFEECSVRGIQS